MHTLPEGKRVPRSAAEKDEVWRRSSSVASAILAKGEEIGVVISYLNGYRGEQEPNAVRRLGGEWVGDSWRRQWMHDEREAQETENGEFALTIGIWDSNEYADVIAAVALGEAAPILIVSATTGRVYSPYDGGVDLFVEDRAKRAELELVFQAWRSPRPDGL